jgi:hypothetical protein
MLHSSENMIFGFGPVYRHELFILNFGHVKVVFSDAPSFNRGRQSLLEQLLG